MKNESKLKCNRCSLVIFRENTAERVEISPVDLASIKKDSQNEESVTEFWMVDDMMKFENIGFSNEAKNGMKYLICADCELGPLGFHDPNKEVKLYYVAVDRLA